MMRRMSSIRDDETPEATTGIPSTARPSATPPSIEVPRIEVTEELLRALPKTDLHCHLDGSLRLATILELAEKDGVRLPSDTIEGVAKAIHQGATCGSLEDYLKAFDVTLSVMQTEESLYRAAYE